MFTEEDTIRKLRQSTYDTVEQEMLSILRNTPDISNKQHATIRDQVLSKHYWTHVEYINVKYVERK